MVYSNSKNHAKVSKSFIIIVSNFHSHENDQREPIVFFLKAILLVYLKCSNLRMVHTVLTIMHWKIPYCDKILGHLKIMNFPFVPNENFIILGVPKLGRLQSHYNVLQYWHTKNHKFSICDKWNINGSRCPKT